MQQQNRQICLSLGLALLAAMPLAAQLVPAPEAFLGFVQGPDRKLIEWPVLIEYCQRSVGTCPLFFNALKPYRKTGKP